MRKRNIVNEIKKQLYSYDINITDTSKLNEIVTITCDNYMIHINDKSVNVNFNINCCPLESAKLISMLNKIKDIDVYMGYLYTITKTGKILIDNKAKEYTNRQTYEELSGEFVKDYYQRVFLLNNQAGEC